MRDLPTSACCHVAKKEFCGSAGFRGCCHSNYLYRRNFNLDYEKSGGIEDTVGDTGEKSTTVESKEGKLFVTPYQLHY